MQISLFFTIINKIYIRLENMDSKKIIDYIKRSRNQGLTDEEVKSKLLKSGWKKNQVEEAFSLADNGNNENQVEFGEKQSVSSFDGRGLKRVIISIAFIAVLFAGGVFAYNLFTGIYSYFGNGDLAAQNEIRSALDNMSDLDNYSSTLNVDFDVLSTATTLGDEEPMITRFIGSTSLTSKVDGEAEELKLILNGEGKIQDERGGELVQELSASGEGEIFLVDDKLFGVLDDLSTPAEIPLFGIGFDESQLVGEDVLLIEEFSKEFGDNLFEDGAQDDFREGLTSILKQEMGEDVDPEEVDEAIDFFLEKFWEKEVVTVTNTVEEKIGDIEVNRHDLDFSLVNFNDFANKFGEKFGDTPDYQSVYYCVDGDGNAGEFSGETVNPDGNSCEEVFPEGYFEGERIGTASSIFSARGSAYDTQIRSELSQARSRAERHYYDNDGTYRGFENSEDWTDLRNSAPECSKKIMDGEGYQINTSDQEYAAWGAQCVGSEELEEIQREELKEVDEELKEIFSISVWTDGEYIYKIEVIAEVSEEEEMPDFSDLEIAISLEWEGFGDSLNLEKPEEYMTIYELEEFMRREIDPESVEPVEPPEPEEGDGVVDDGDTYESTSRNRAFDTQIRSELSQIRSNAEMYYYDNDGAYEGFKDSDGWKEIKSEIPDCSISRLEGDAANAVATEAAQYQINVEDGERAQSYAAWAPLCAEEAFFCIDSDGNARQYDSGTVNPEGEDCEGVFEGS